MKRWLTGFVLLVAGCSSSSSRPPDTAERPVALTVASHASGGMAVTGVRPSSASTSSDAVGALARLNQRTVVFDFTTPLQSDTIVIDQVVPLNTETGGDCSLEIGTYDVARVQVAATESSAVVRPTIYGSVAIPVIDNPDFTSRPHHRRRRSKCVDCCPRW